MKKNNSWFSIIFAMWYLVILSMIVIVLHEYLIPFSKNVKWIENSSNAYYQSLAWIEQALYDKKSLALWNEKILETSGRIKYKYEIFASWSVLPPAWKWNSDFDKDWNKIWFWEPIQLRLINKNIDWSDVEFYFRVPDLDWISSTTENLIEPVIWEQKIINWQYSGSWFVLNSSTWSMITVDNINSWNIQKLDSKIWIIIWASIEREKINPIDSKPTINFENFDDWWNSTNIDNYTENINITPCSSTTCTLKISIINKLVVEKNWINQEIPYLEYKIVFPSWTTVPTRFIRIESDWISNWFKKNLKIKIPQYTTIWAFDFTVFQ